MKKIFTLLLAFSFFFISACSCTKDDDNKITFDHYLRGGGKEELDARISWKYETSAFVKYQITYTSYICSDPSVNYVNVLYIELTTKGTKEDSLIRNLSFSTIEENDNEFNVGLWGDYKKLGTTEIYNEVNDELLPALKLKKYSEIKDIASNGYGNYLNMEGMEDVLIGATVSGSNVVSIIKAIFDYHIENYY